MNLRLFTNRDGKAEAIVTGDQFQAVFVQEYDFDLVELTVDGCEIPPADWWMHKASIQHITDILYSRLFKLPLQSDAKSVSVYFQ